jgi:hypothetical protein
MTKVLAKSAKVSEVRPLPSPALPSHLAECHRQDMPGLAERKEHLVQGHQIPMPINPGEQLVTEHQVGFTIEPGEQLVEASNAGLDFGSSIWPHDDVFQRPGQALSLPGIG